MNPMTRLKIKQQLLLLFVLLVTPVFLMNGYANRQVEKTIKDQVTDAYSELIKQSHSLIGRDIDTVNKITTTIIQNPITQRLEPNVNEAESVLDRVKSYVALDALLESYSLGVNGGQSISYWLFVLDSDESYSFAPDFRGSKNGGVHFIPEHEKPMWFDEAISMKGKGFLRIIDQYGADGETTLAYIRVVNDLTGGSQPKGILIATNMEKQIEDSLHTVSLPQGDIYFTDMEQNLYAGTEGGIGTSIKLPSSVQLNKTGNEVINRIESDHIYIMHTDSIQQHRLIYQIPVSSLVQQQNELKRTIQRVSIVYFILCLLVMLYFSRSLIVPLQRMASFFKSYEPGKIMPHTTEVSRKDEIGVLISSIYDMSNRLNILIHDKYVMEIKHKEMQLQILYEQINPHLLYNTLESIYWNSSLHGDTESAEMIKELSKLMRIGLSRGRDLIRIEEELEHAKAYLSLQMKRYEYEFQVNWIINEKTLTYIIPKITLQPLLENAIVHGVRNMGADGEITIATYIEDHVLCISVEDNGFKAMNLQAIQQLLNTEDGDPTIGYGISNVHRRIRMHFGIEYGLEYAVREPQGTKVVMRLPLSLEEETNVKID